MSAPSTYEFDGDFQAKIAAMILRDPLFNQRTAGLVNPAYFENVIDAALVNLGLSYFTRYKRCADLTILKKLFKALFEKKILREDLKGEAKDRLGRLLREDIGDRDFVIDEVETFAKHQALEQAIIEAVDHLKRRDFAKISTSIKKAMEVGVTAGLGEYDYFGEIENRTRIRKDKAAGLLKPEGITTGVHALDAELLHKGWGRRELTVLLGGAKAGKTTALSDFAKNASFAGFNVLYLTLEVSAKIIAERLDANVSDTVISKLGDHINNVQEKVKEAQAKSGKLIVREFPTGSLHPSDVRRLIAHYQAKGTVFDIIVVDYADLMAPDYRTQDPIENSKSIYIDLRAIAQEENVAMLTATQSNREGFKAATVKAEHVAEDFNKIRIADLVISINRTEEEKGLGEARLYFAASRNQQGGFTLRIKQDLEKMKFLIRVLSKE